MVVRTEAEIKACIENVEQTYPQERIVLGTDSIGTYCLGVLAGLKIALGEYPTFAEIDLEEFLRTNYSEMFGI